MAVGDLVTEPYQYEYAGFVFGPNTGFHGQSVTGLLGYPALRSGTVNSFGNHGGSAGRHYMPVREFIAKFDFVTNDDAEFAAARKAAIRAFRPRVLASEAEPFVFWHPGSDPAIVYARPTDYNLPIDRQFALKNPQWTIRFEAADAYQYSLLELSTQVTLAADLTGLTFPLSFPLQFGPSQSSAASLLNNGTAPAHWRAEITGPVQGPRLEKIGTGEILNLPNLNVEAGETLIIDTKNRQILLNGTASRRGNLTAASRWFYLDPETSTTISYQSNGAPSGSTVTFTWRHQDWGDL